MKEKNAVLIGFLLALCAIGITTIAMTKSSLVTQQSIESGKRDERRGSIKWFVARAKEEKKTKVFVPPPEEFYAVVSDLDDAALHYASVLVEPVSQKTAILNDSDIVTWHKFKVVEFISYPTKGCLHCPSGLAVPQEMLPLEASEILVPTSGGSLTIDGIQLESRKKDFDESFSATKRYLLFLSFDPTTAVGRIPLGPNGIFEVTEQDQIVPIIQGVSPIRRDLELKFGNSLTRVRDHLRTRSK